MMNAEGFFRRAARIRVARLLILGWCVGNVSFAIYNIFFGGADLMMTAQLFVSLACVSLVSAAVDDNGQRLLAQFKTALTAHGIKADAVCLLRNRVSPSTEETPGYMYADGMIVAMEAQYELHESRTDFGG